MWFFTWRRQATNFILKIVRWVAMRIERIADKIDRLFDKFGDLATRRDIDHVLHEIKALRDDLKKLSKPRLSIELGQPTDQTGK